MPRQKITHTDTLQAVHKSGTLLMVVASIFLALIMVCAIIFVSAARNNARPGGNTITVTGSGEGFAVPDIATFWFTLRAEGDNVAVAQEQVTRQSKDVISALRQEGIEEKDIQTTGYNAYPRYEWQQKTIVCPLGSDCPPGDRERILVGYEVSQNVRVKVRDITISGEILGTLGGLNVDNINGPSLEIDDEDSIQAEAREEAIADAKSKAKALASQLDVRLGKVVSFQEGGGYGGYGGMMVAETMAMRADFDDAVEESAMPTLNIPVGENEIRSNVTITYRIK
jgi:hypothetical protein